MSTLGFRRKRCSVSAAFALALGLAVVASARQQADAATIRRLKDSALNGRAFSYVADLTRTIGARLSGTAAYERAAQWSADQFRNAGVTGVALERFTIPRGWERLERGQARITTPFDRPLILESFGWAPSLPDGGIEAEVILGDQDMTASPERARGRIVFVTHDSRNLDRRMQEAGAAALLFPAGGPDDEIAARVRIFGGTIAPLPMALLTPDSVDILRDALRRGVTRIRMSYRNQVSDGPVAVSNVIAEIRGRERPDEFVVVGAHLDSWDSATGAQDNATGVAMVLEAARAIAALGRNPRRTIRFALWAAEEQGLLGSAAYVRDHEGELDHCVAVLNADGGTGRILGWTTPGRDDVMATMRELSRPLLADLRAAGVDKSMQYAFDSDGGPFIRQGIPTLDMNVDDDAYEQIHHKATDTIDRVDERNLATGAAVVAVTAYAIADASNRLAPRGPRHKE